MRVKKVVKDTAQSNKSPTYLTHHKLGFCSGEHSQILASLPAWFPEKVKINGFEIETRKIIAFADFFTTNTFENLLEKDSIVTIADPKVSSKEAVFDAIFNKTFAENQRKKLEKFLTIIAKEEAGINEYKRKNLPPSGYYNQHGAALEIECIEAAPEDYLIAELVNFDHFLPDALVAWETGRDIAYRCAVEFYAETDLEKKQEMLHLACAKLAFALHYFTDAFSSGHIVTPRHELVKHSGLFFGSLLAKEQHNEACRFGLNVMDKSKKKWVAYGDGRYFDDVNNENRSILDSAIRGILENLENVLKTGKIPEDNKEIRMIPEIQSIQENCNPLFKVNEDGKLLRRSEANNPLCQDYTERWSTLSTLLERWLQGSLKKIKNCFSLFFCCFLPMDDDESGMTKNFNNLIKKIEVPEQLKPLFNAETEKVFDDHQNSNLEKTQNFHGLN